MLCFSYPIGVFLKTVIDKHFFIPLGMKLLLSLFFVSLSVTSFTKGDQIITIYFKGCFVFHLSDIDTTQFSGIVNHNHQIFIVNEKDLYTKQFVGLRTKVKHIAIENPGSYRVLNLNLNLFKNLRYLVFIGNDTDDSRHIMLNHTPYQGKKFKGIKHCRMTYINVVKENLKVDLPAKRIKLRKISWKKAVDKYHWMSYGDIPDCIPE